MQNIKLLDIPLILRTIRKYPTYEVYPYIYYVDKYGDLHDVPSRENVEVATWIIPFADGTGLVVHRINGEDVILRAYEITERIEENNELVERLTKRLVDVINKLDLSDSKLLSINNHVIEGIAVALGLEKDYVSQIIREAMIKERLEDRNVAIFDDIVILLSKRYFMIRYDGEEIVELAKRYAYIIDAPIYYIAEKHIPNVLGRRTTTFIFPNSAIICNPYTCYNMPLPSNLSYIIAKKTGSKIVDLEKGDPIEYRDKKLYVPNICIAKNKLLILTREGRDRYGVREVWRTRVRPAVPLVFSPRGFLGYGKIFLRNNTLYVEVKAVEKERGKEREEAEDSYLEEVILGS